MGADSSNQTAERIIADLMHRSLNFLALERLLEALDDEPNNTKLRFLLGEVYVSLLDFHQAKKVFEELRIDDPDNQRILFMLPRALMGMGDKDGAIGIAKNFIASHPEHEARGRLALADFYERVNQPEKSRETLEQITTRDDEIKASCCFTEGRILIQEKRYEEAVVTIRQFIEMRNAFEYEVRVNKAEEAWFQLAKAYDKMEEYDKAWEAAEEAHAPYRGWDSTRLIAEFESIRTFMTRPLLEGLARANEQYEWDPLFIVGMPRSGTTLLEQIIGMHPSVTNGGEMSISVNMINEMSKITDSLMPWPKTIIDLRVDDTNRLGHTYMDALRPFAGDSKIVSNKSLMLQSQLGFLSMALPNSRSIMLYRHPLDNAVSCHTTSLVSIGHRYTTDLSTFGKVWVARRKLQEHWLEHLDIPMLELHYESLVQNQEMETRRILEFLDVEWDADCLDFHKSTNLARTISFDQVNRKMYSTSDGRWRNYEKYLGPVIDEVGDYL